MKSSYELQLEKKGGFMVAFAATDSKHQKEACKIKQLFILIYLFGFLESAYDCYDLSVVIDCSIRVPRLPFILSFTTVSYSDSVQVLCLSSWSFLALDYSLILGIWRL